MKRGGSAAVTALTQRRAGHVSGWRPALVELLMGEYGQSLHDAVFVFPLRAAFALIPPRGERLGMGGQGASYGDEASLRKRAEVKGWIEKHFEVVPKL